MRASRSRAETMLHNQPIRRVPSNAPAPPAARPGICRLLVIIALAVTSFADAHAAERPVLSSAVIRGVSAYTPAQLFAAYRDQLGRPITRESAQAILLAIEEMYVRDGYSRPGLRLRDDLVADGILRIDVSEPRITRVTITGDSGPYRETLESLAAGLADEQPLRRLEVQRVIQRMRELPGLSVTANTRRDTAQPDGYELALDASFEPIEGVVRLTNRGTREIGPHFMLGQVVANSLFGQAEKLGLLFGTAGDFDEYHGFGAFADVPVRAGGTRAMVMGFRSLSEPHEAPQDLPDEFVRDKISLKVTHPLQLDSGRRVSVSGGLEVDDLEIERDGLLIREDRLRIAELGGRLSWRSGDSTQYLGTLELRRGLDGLGSELRAADLAADPRRRDFLLTRLQLVRLTRLSEVWSLRVDALAQHSGYVLPYSERFKIGGDRLGRGFEVAEIAGDRGVGAKAELRRDLPGAAGFFGKASAYGYCDYGAAWKQDVSGTESAGTAGVGLGARGGRMNGYLELALPLTHTDVEGESDASVFAELSYRF